MAWNDFLGGDQLTPTDPLQLLQSIVGSAPPDAVTKQGVAPKIPNLPHDVMPSRPVGPIEQAVQPGGKADWASLLTQLGPLLASAALHEPAQRTGFLNGYMQGHSLAQQEKDKRTQATQAKNQAAANYRLEVGNHAQAITDPVQRAQFIDNAEQSGVLAGFLKPGDLASMRDVPPGQQAQARLKELVDHLTTLEKNGYNLDELAQSKATIKLNDGQDVPVSTALDLTRERPRDAKGQPIVKPEATGKTAEERFMAKWAKQSGKTVDTLTAADELQAKTDYANAGKAPAEDDYSRFLDAWAKEHGAKSGSALTVAQQLEAKKAYGGTQRNPQLDEINLALKQLQLQNEKGKATPVDIQPGSKEYKIADDLATGKLTFSEFRSLYSYSRDVNAKTSIYMKASEINPNFNPAMYEMGYKFASNPKTQNQMASINNVLSGVPDLLKVSDAASRSGVTVLNSFINSAGYALGGKRYSNLKIARTAFADELSGALGYGSATDMSREMGFDMTDPNLSPENFKSALQDVVIPFVNRKKASLLGPMGIYGNEAINPAAANPKIGTPPPATGIPSYEEYKRSKGAK